MSQRGPIIALVAAFLLAILLVVFLVMPKMGDVEEAEQRLDEAEGLELTLQTELSRLEDSAANAGQLRAELARNRRAVPPVADLTGLINDLQAAADVAGVDFFSIAPGSPTPAVGATATEIPASIPVIGGFFPVDSFLKRLETMPRKSKVISITVGPGAQDLPQLDVQLDVRFYTTDLEAGPGAPPPATATEPAPTTTVSPGASPSPGESPTTIPSPTPGA